MGTVLYEGNGVQVKRSHGGPKGLGVTIGAQDGSVWLSLEQVAGVAHALMTLICEETPDIDLVARQATGVVVQIHLMRAMGIKVPAAPPVPPSPLYDAVVDRLKEHLKGIGL